MEIFCSVPDLLVFEASSKCVFVIVIRGAQFASETSVEKLLFIMPLCTMLKIALQSEIQAHSC